MYFFRLISFFCSFDLINELLFMAFFVLYPRDQAFYVLFIMCLTNVIVEVLKYAILLP